MPWQNSLRLGHIVSYKFPHIQEAGEEPEKNRPGLVLDVLSDANGPRRALIAYGTSIMHKWVPRGDLVLRIDAPLAIAAAGLDRPTRFRGGRTVAVTLDDPRFDLKNDSPIIGRLPRCCGYHFKQVRRRIYRDVRRNMGASVAA